MWNLLSVLVTVGLGSRFAFIWQQRSAREARFFDASHSQYKQMSTAAKRLADIVGRRIYATHRVCRLTTKSSLLQLARNDFQNAIIEWNQEHLQTDLDIRTLFRDSSVHEFERLQSLLASHTSKVHRYLNSSNDAPAYELLRDLESIRGLFFRFIQSMLDESNSLFRQMHFGVRLSYNCDDIYHYSTWQLVKALFSGPDEESSVISPPINFGVPIATRDARLGIHKH